MKKLITCMLLASLLVFGLAGAASAAVDNSAISSLLGDGNSATTSIAGVGSGTIWRPATFSTTVTTATLSATVLGTKGSGSVTFNPPGLLNVFNWADPSQFHSSMTQATAFAINSSVSPLIAYVNQGTAAAAARTAQITGDTAAGGWASKINTAAFQNLYTPAPVSMQAPALAGGALTYGLTAYPVPGDMMGNYQVGQLEVWKFIPAQANNGAKDARKYSLATTTADITGTTDGQIWFTTDANGASIMSSSSTFASNATYYMWMELRDNGNFDLDSSTGVIVDPPTVTPATSTGSSSSGCVYNPAAGLSLDMLFLAVPALGVLVSRIRRK